MGCRAVLVADIEILAPLYMLALDGPKAVVDGSLLSAASIMLML